jgi:hypothetical protein
MRQRVPIPELTEHDHHDHTGVSAAGSALQTNRDVAATSMDETLSESSTETCHGIFVFVQDNLGVQGLGQGYRWRGGFILQ